MSTPTMKNETPVSVAGLAEVDRRAARILVRADRDRAAAQERRLDADAAADRRRQDRADRIQVDREERQARQAEKRQDRADRRAARADRRSARAARVQARRAARRALLAGWTVYVRDNAAAVYCSVIYGQAVAGAVYGQVTNEAIGPLLVRIVIAIAIEGLALAMALTALQQRLRGERALAARALTWLGALTAAALNFGGHWDPEHPVKAIVLAVLSLAGIVVWEIRSGARNRAELRRRGMIPEPPSQFGWRRWLRFPRSTYSAWSIDVHDRVSGDVRTLLARAAIHRAEQTDRRRRRQLARTAHRAAGKAVRAGETGPALAALVRLADLYGQPTPARPAIEVGTVTRTTEPDRPGPAREAVTEPTQDRTAAGPDHTPRATPGPKRTAGPDGGTVTAITAARRTTPVLDRLADGPDVSDLLPAGRAVVAELTRQGRQASRRTLLAGLRDRGQSCSTDRAKALLAVLANDPTEHHQAPAEQAEDTQEAGNG